MLCCTQRFFSSLGEDNLEKRYYTCTHSILLSNTHGCYVYFERVRLISKYLVTNYRRDTCMTQPNGSLPLTALLRLKLMQLLFHSYVAMCSSCSMYSIIIKLVFPFDIFSLSIYE